MHSYAFNRLCGLCGFSDAPPQLLEIPITDRNPPELLVMLYVQVLLISYCGIGV